VLGDRGVMGASTVMTSTVGVGGPAGGAEGAGPLVSWHRHEEEAGDAERISSSERSSVVRCRTFRMVDRFSRGGD